MLVSLFNSCVLTTRHMCAARRCSNSPSLVPPRPQPGSTSAPCPRPLGWSSRPSGTSSSAASPGKTSWATTSAVSIHSLKCVLDAGAVLTGEGCGCGGMMSLQSSNVVEVGLIQCVVRAWQSTNSLTGWDYPLAPACCPLVCFKGLATSL